jgi:hypothetical protein
MELWTHIIEEFGSRGMGLPPNCLDRETVPMPTAPTPAKGFLESKNMKLDTSCCLTKYGDRSWLIKTMETGEWRLSPASFYSGAALNKARQDSELDFHISVANLEKTSIPVNEIGGEYYHIIKGIFAIDIKAARDYYLACLARGLVYRMFDDFNADACLIIHDEVEFCRRMFKAFADVNPNWYGTLRAVDYVDPCMPKLPMNVYFAKHFRYAYQEEMRFVWMPPSCITELPQFTINLGPLNDICELLLIGVN